MVGLAVGAGLLAMPAAVSPAKADCVYLTLYVTREAASPTYVNNGCVPHTDTPWMHDVTLSPRYTGTGHPAGTPNGVFMDLRVPLP